MATIQMARVTPLSEYSDNLLNYNSTFNNDLAFSVVSGSGLVECNNEHTFQGANALKITNYLSSPMTVSTSANLGFTATQDGYYIFSLRLFYESSNGDDPSFLLNIFRNAVADNQYNCFYTNDFIPNNWITFAQTMYFEAGDVISFNFDFNPAFINDKIWVDGLKCELDDRGSGIPTNWTMPIDYCCSGTGWQSIVNTSTTQVITADTETQIIFTGIEQENGGLDFMDNTGVITPLQENDTLTIDVAFSFVVPSGTTNYFSFYVKIDGVIFRGLSVPMVRDTGAVQYFSQSFTLPVSSSFMGKSARCYIDSNVGITLSNRYISVARLHKAKI